ncbi:DJ-1 family protein [Klebsiella pneumoniae]|uniref:DJ-1 family protein n=1 Tax=Klebsiella pneumoniae TaxID=573 RepID=A0A378F872_KLEPN|nr:DJ-1 family protein [Klebsiella pneumoniae]
MSASALICLAPGSEETEAVTTIDLLVRGGVKVTTASVASDGSLTIVCSRGVKLLADAPLVEVADGDFDIIVLPGVSRRRVLPRQHATGGNRPPVSSLWRIVAAICAAPGDRAGTP